VRIHHSLWDLFSSLDEAPDAGVRTLMRLRPELVEEVACKGTSADIDTPEDLSLWT
jgi:CTP:molybdopterin cytidylyltransferase MocA